MFQSWKNDYKLFAYADSVPYKKKIIYIYIYNVFILGVILCAWLLLRNKSCYYGEEFEYFVWKKKFMQFFLCIFVKSIVELREISSSCCGKYFAYTGAITDLSMIFIAIGKMTDSSWKRKISLTKWLKIVIYIILPITLKYKNVEIVIGKKIYLHINFLEHLTSIIRAILMNKL